MEYIVRKTQALKSKTYSLFDFRTDRHIVVLESDDWGSIRVPSVEVRAELMKESYAMDKRPYEWYDTLEANEDVEALFDVLRKYRDMNGHHPVITVNYLSQNPDFEKIRENGFSQYVGESIEDTYKSYPSSDRVIELMRTGIAEGLVMPQCHGREHLNVGRWMRDLQAGDSDALRAFEAKMPGIFPKNDYSKGNRCLVALRMESASEQPVMNETVRDGLWKFEKIWGFRSETFVACNYELNQGIENVLHEMDVKLVQTIRKPRTSTDGSRVYHYAGQRRKSGLVYSVRNCIFEPTAIEQCRDLNHLIGDVESCFRHHRVAVIAVHRINFVGSLDSANRNRTLELLDGFFGYLQTKYADIEYLSSDQLVDVLR